METIDLFAVDFFDQMEGILRANSFFLAEISQLVSALFALLYLSYKVWFIILGDEQWQIAPLLRPFALALAISFFPTVVSLIEVPGRLFLNVTNAQFEAISNQVDDQIWLKNRILTEHAQKLSEKAEEAKAVSESPTDEKEGGFFSFGTEALEDLARSVSGIGMFISAQIEFLMQEIVMWLGLAFFQLCFYVIKFFEVIFKFVLIILGPIAFAFSIFPAFASSYTAWIARFISITLYSVVARIINVVALSFIKYGADYETQLYEQVNDSEEAFVTFTLSNGASPTILLVAYIAGGIALLTVPIISNWVVQSSGAGAALSKMVQGGKAVTTGGASMIQPSSRPSAPTRSPGN